MSASSITPSPPGGMFWRSRNRAANSTSANSPRSRISCATRAAGRLRMAARQAPRSDASIMRAFDRLALSLLYRLEPEQAHDASLWALEQGLAGSVHEADDPILATRV